MMFLQPVTDVKDTWAALALHLPRGGEHDSQVLLSSVLNDLRLAEALGRLFCIIRVDQIAGFDLPVVHGLRFGQIILRIPVAQCVDPALARDFARLKKEGFAFMADGAVSGGDILNEHVTMFALHERIAVDPHTAHWIDQLSGPHMAEHITSRRQFEQAKNNGVRWFAGLELRSAAQEMSRQDTITRARLLRLLELVTQDANVSELEVLLKQDPALSYQLFKLLGSAAFSFKVEIASFAQAINLLGRRQLQRWLQLLLYARPVGSDGAATSLLPRAAVRAAFMEALCREQNGSRDAQDKAYLVGMFSLLDLLFGIPLAQVLQPLTLGRDITDALLDKAGELGALLVLAERAEYSEGALLQQDALNACAVTVESYCHSLVHAYRWASRVSSED